MEVAAAVPRTKKRRSEAAGIPKPEETGTISLVANTPGAGCDEFHSQEPPPAAGGGGGTEEEEDGIDRISGLPDAILGEIVSLLSTQDAARVQTLASRWRHIWRSATLTLEARDLPSDDDEAFVGAVNRILSAHPGPGNRFCIPPHHLCLRPATVDAWLRSPALDNLQELDFWEHGYYWQRPEFRPVPPTASAFRFSATLRVATFSKCHLVDHTVEALHFPQLRQLGLADTLISEGSLHTMISSCPALECLLLDNSFGFRCVRISSSSIKSICVGANRRHDEGQLRELIIVDAPYLERLLHLHLHMDVHVSIISAPKLETIGCLNDALYPTRFVFGTAAAIEVPAACLFLSITTRLLSCISTIAKFLSAAPANGLTFSFCALIDTKGMRIVKFTSEVRNIKILAVKPWDINLDMVIELMKCFPCLEKLYIKSCISGNMNLWRRKHRNFIKSFDIRLKTVVLQYYRAIKSQVNFASFFILNARELS